MNVGSCRFFLLVLLVISISLLLEGSDAWMAAPRSSIFISKNTFPQSFRSSPFSLPRGTSSGCSFPLSLSSDSEQLEKKTAKVNMAVKLIGSSTTFVVSGIFFIVLAWRRDALMVSFFIGSIVNAILSKTLKKIINQTRPLELSEDDHPGDQGMPSSHAMSLGFIATFVALEYPIIQIPSLIYTVVSLWYRIQVKLHTWQQIVVGAVVGSLNGYVWFHLCNGANPWNIHIMDQVTQHLLVDGVLPLPLLAAPLLIGAVTIGSFTRRIRKLLKDKNQ